MVAEDWSLDERYRDADGGSFIVPYRDVNNGYEESEPETESASESDNDEIDMMEWERIMNLVVRIGETIARVRSPSPTP